MTYSAYMQKALRGVVHDILADVARDGLNGEAYYYITFETNRPDVIIPDFVRAKYPKEISIVLQNQFSHLVVEPAFFEVDLAFGGVNTTVHVPFCALKFFADPSAQFGLTLEPQPFDKALLDKEKGPDDDKPGADTSLTADVIDLADFRKRK